MNKERKDGLIDHEFAADLLLSVGKEEDISSGVLLDEYRSVCSDLVLLPNGNVAAGLPALLGWEDKSFRKVYDEGRTRMLKTLTTVDDNDFAGTLLEAMYTWLLGVRLAKYGGIWLGETRVVLACSGVEAGRLFPGGNSFEYDLSVLKPGVLFYAKERDGLNTHPLADIFFRSDDGKLVLIDVYGGGNAGNANEKGHKLVKWIREHEAKVIAWSAANEPGAEAADRGDRHLARAQRRGCGWCCGMRHRSQKPARRPAAVGVVDHVIKF